MCGICGIVYSGAGHPVDKTVLLEMRDVLSHRGPDDAGIYLAPGIGLGSRRLAILDLSDRGHMPMATPDGRFWIVYNGEIYNYRQLRAPLEARGYRFKSNSDTEVLLSLFAAEGPTSRCSTRCVRANCTLHRKRKRCSRPGFPLASIMPSGTSFSAFGSSPESRRHSKAYSGYYPGTICCGETVGYRFDGGGVWQNGRRRCARRQYPIP